MVSCWWCWWWRRGVIASCHHLEWFAGWSMMVVVVISFPVFRDPCRVMFMCLLTHFHTLHFLYCSATPLYIQIYYRWCTSHVLEVLVPFSVCSVCYRYLQFCLAPTCPACPACVGEGNLRWNKHDHPSLEALKAEYKAHGLLLAMAVTCNTLLHGYIMGLFLIV